MIRHTFRPVACAIALGIALGVTGTASAVDADGAQTLIRKSDCTKCHAVDKKKDGPSFKETAGKYKGKADGAQKLFTHLTTNPKVKIDGKEEEHASLKTKNEAEVRNVVEWILSR